MLEEDKPARHTTAAERVIAIPELRQDIMSRLSRKELAVVMRSSKILFDDAVAVVYAHMNAEEVNKMTRKTVSTSLLPHLGPVFAESDTSRWKHGHCRASH